MSPAHLTGMNVRSRSTEPDAGRPQGLLDRWNSVDFTVPIKMVPALRRPLNRRGSRHCSSRVPRRILRVACIGFVGFLSPLWAETISLNPTADTTLHENSPDNNLGGNVNFISGAGNNGARNRALVQFDIAGTIPAGSIIDSVSLELTLVAAAAGPGSTFTLHRVLQSWGEGGKSGNQGEAATEGEATWNARFFSETLWSTPGAAAPDDFSSSASAALLMSGVGQYEFQSTAGLVADVQAWLDDPGANFGWILISDAEGTAQTTRRFASREDALGVPVLHVAYTIPEPGTIVLTILGGLVIIGGGLSRRC